MASWERGGHITINIGAPSDVTAEMSDENEQAAPTTDTLGSADEQAGCVNGSAADEASAGALKTDDTAELQGTEERRERPRSPEVGTRRTPPPPSAARWTPIPRRPQLMRWPLMPMPPTDALRAFGRHANGCDDAV